MFSSLWKLVMEAGLALHVHTEASVDLLYDYFKNLSANEVDTEPVKKKEKIRSKFKSNDKIALNNPKPAQGTRFGRIACKFTTR